MFTGGRGTDFEPKRVCQNGHTLFDKQKRLNVLPRDYHPFGKNRFEAVQGLYGELLTVFNWVFWFLSIGILIKLAANMTRFNDFCLLGCVECAVCVFVVLLLLIVLRCCHNNQLYS